MDEATRRAALRDLAIGAASRRFLHAGFSPQPARQMAAAAIEAVEEAGLVIEEKKLAEHTQETT